MPTSKRVVCNMMLQDLFYGTSTIIILAVIAVPVLIGFMWALSIVFN